MDLNLAMGSGSNEKNFSSIGDRWTKLDGELVGKGPGWAGYEKSCGNGTLSLKFNLENLTGGVQANINMNGPDHYAIGFVNMGNSALRTYLLKQVGKISSSSKQQFSGGAKIYNQTQIIYNQTKKYQVEVISEDGNIRVFIDKAEQEFGERLPVIDYHDSNPLPPGKIDFETLENSSAILSDVITDCSPSKEEKPPNLGIGYFKRPDPNSLISTK
jgi:hypothetical protein